MGNTQSYPSQTEMEIAYNIVSDIKVDNKSLPENTKIGFATSFPRPGKKIVLCQTVGQSEKFLAQDIMTENPNYVISGNQVTVYTGTSDVLVPDKEDEYYPFAIFVKG